jgi:MarR family transcriptional regulator, negative regulator of the multidrug operon emrRAB
VYLTDDGRRAADGVLDARGDSLRRVVERLDDDGRRALADGLEQLLTSLYEEVGVADRMCRLCDRRACTSKASTCPVGAAECAHELTTTDTDSDQ